MGVQNTKKPEFSDELHWVKLTEENYPKFNTGVFLLLKSDTRHYYGGYGHLFKRIEDSSGVVYQFHVNNHYDIENVVYFAEMRLPEDLKKTDAPWG